MKKPSMEYPPSIFAEVGQYFLPDGQLDEAAFRVSLHNRFKQDNRMQTGDTPPDGTCSISDYLNAIISYVSDKGMPQSAYRLFKIAIDEATRLGIKDVTVSPEFLSQVILDNTQSQNAKTDDKGRLMHGMRQKIFHAALHIIAQKGFHRAKMEEIAVESGVGKGSLYRYFKNKEDLLNQLLIDKYQMITERFSQLFSEGGDILQQIQMAIEFYMRFIEENPVAYRLIQNETISQGASRSGKKKITFYAYLARHLPMLKERVIALNRERKLKTTDFYSVFYGILGYMDGVAQKWFMAGMNYPLMKEVPLALEVLFNGFVGETATRRHFYQGAKKG